LQDVTLEELLSSCRILFGSDVEITSDFLWYLQLEGARSAYWRRAKESHPDAHPDAETHMQDKLGYEFDRVAQSYQLLCKFLRYREQTNFMLNGIFGKVSPTIQESHEGRKQESNNSRDLFYYGKLPNNEIKTARYLYYRGVTSFQSIFDALTWQREQRPLIGVLARQWGWMNDVTVREILTAKHLRGRFCDRALAIGALTTGQRDKLICYQQSCQQRIGKYFIQIGVVSEHEMESLSLERIIHNNLVMNSRK
jgi:hypothetical protein